MSLTFRGVDKANPLTGESLSMGVSGSKLMAVVNLYLRVNKISNDKKFSKKIPLPEDPIPPFAGKKTFVFSSGTLRRTSRHTPRMEEGLKVTIRSDPDERGVDVYIPHVEDKVWRDAVHMRVEGKVATVYSFFLSTVPERAAMEWGKLGISSVHLATMRCLEIVASSFGATTLHLSDAASTRVTKRVGPKRYVYVDIPNRSAQLKIEKDDPYTHTYHRYGFRPLYSKVGRSPPISSHASLSFFLEEDTANFPYPLFSKEELESSLREVARFLLSDVRQAVEEA